MSITTSSISAYETMASEFPQLVQYLREPVHFSRGASKHPTSRLHIRIRSSTRKAASSSAVEPQSRHVRAEIPGVPQISAEHWRALETFDQIVRRPDLAHTMWLRARRHPDHHVTLHSRTEFLDHEESSKKRLLFRGSHPRTAIDCPNRGACSSRRSSRAVRGGIIGQHHDAKCKAFEERQAAAMHMRPPSA